MDRKLFRFIAILLFIFTIVIRAQAEEKFTMGMTVNPNIGSQFTIGGSTSSGNNSLTGSLSLDNHGNVGTSISVTHNFTTDSGSGSLSSGVSYNPQNGVTGNISISFSK